MTGLNPAMRLKVKGDTFYLPDPNGGVYFRNNVGSFRMEGAEIDQWIEILLPMFNGNHTLEELTDGLPDQHRKQVYEIAEMLLRNGFVRDVSQDRPHSLPDWVLNRYASQIEFLDSLADSGAHRFQSYRQVNVLAAGSGPFLVSLVAALLESGLPKFHVLITDGEQTNRQRLAELAEHARKLDPEVRLDEIAPPMDGAWRDAVKPFQAVLYVSQEGDVELLRTLHAVCREEKKLFLPAICFKRVGLAGPLVHPDSDGCWESVWRRIHACALGDDSQEPIFSSTAGAMLANLLVFECFKAVAGVSQSETQHSFFLLDLETLEGNCHSFLPHPLVTGHATAKWVDVSELRVDAQTERDGSNGLLPGFGRLTSPIAGIFHVWEEGDLKQLPLAQCRVQPADPLAEGPAQLLPEMLGTGLTHEEARREAALFGIEAYVSRLAGRLLSEQNHQEAGEIPGAREFFGVGAGESVAEAVCRGLQTCLDAELGRRMVHRPRVIPVRLDPLEDERCRYYLQALTTMLGMPQFGLGGDVCGFPVVWVEAGGRWHGSAGLNVTLALRKALQHALGKVQNPAANLASQALEVAEVQLEDKVRPKSLAVPAWDEAAHAEALACALQVLKRNGKRLEAVDLAVEPFLKEELAGVFGVRLREEEFR